MTTEPAVSQPFLKTPPRLRHPGLILKFAIFATGMAGIVAEFVLSTLATYLTGNAVFQWTLVMSLMLFAMGLGSRLSKSIEVRLLDRFIIIEYGLSVLCASSAAVSYGLAGIVEPISPLIYLMAVAIGLLIGFEIPLVTRINQDYEELRSNIAGVMEKDYYGALLGGLFFAFVALPRLGLTYTPIALGAVNYLVATVLLASFFRLVEKKKTVVILSAATALFLAGLALVAQPVILYGEQRSYKDKVVLSRQSAYQKIVMTRWKDHYWLFLNGQEQFSTYDEEKYHEPLVHPAMNLAADRGAVLILGGGDGLALREIWKHPGVRAVTMVDLDPVMTDLARNHPLFTRINGGSMADPRLQVVNRDAAAFLKDNPDFFDVILIDLPDPDTVDLAHLYSESFYHLVRRHLRPGGVVVTQAASPYFAPKAFLSILKTMTTAGLTVLPYHNQIPTMGEWGWALGVRDSEARPDQIKARALTLDFNGIPTRFLNAEAMVSMVHFGKGVFFPGWENEIEVNTQARPILPTYYRSGAWNLD